LDLTLVGAQFKASTNIITIHDFSLLSPSKKSTWSINEGDFERKARTNFNINLLNARIALNRKTAIGFGINLRGYGRIRTDPYNFDDSLKDVRDFFAINPTNRPYGGKFIGSSWVEDIR
jgi:hypothetical protein